MKKKPNIYVTKYAASSGIIKFGGDQYKIQDEEGGYMFPTGGLYRFMSFSPKEYFTSKDDAIKDARARVDKKITSLQKQIDKLKSLDFGAA